MSAEGSRNPGPVLVSERSFRSLHSIRHVFLPDQMFDRIEMDRVVAEKLLSESIELPDWMAVAEEADDTFVELPERLRAVGGTDRRTLQLAIARNASLVLIEGKALIEKVKLSYIRSMGAIPLLVQAYQENRIRRVGPLLTALERKGHEMPPPEQLAALRRALAEMEGAG